MNEQTNWPHDPIISAHLTESGAFSEPEPPVLVTSGTSLTPIFINAEKLCRDQDIGAFLSKNEYDSTAIALHAVGLMREHSAFREDIAILADKVATLFDKYADGRPIAVSGGMRRDLIFSAPIALMLDVPHITLYKEGLRGLVSRKDDFYVIHVVDLLTKGSSVADGPTSEGSVGWAPQVRALGATLEHVVAVVDRQQGAAENLAAYGLTIHPAVALDKQFLERHAQNPEAAIDYIADDAGWTMRYLAEHGVDILVPYFQPNTPKLARGVKFLGHFAGFLNETGLYGQLDEKVQSAYGQRIEKLVDANE